MWLCLLCAPLYSCNMLLNGSSCVTQVGAPGWLRGACAAGLWCAEVLCRTKQDCLVLLVLLHLPALFTLCKLCCCLGGALYVPDIFCFAGRYIFQAASPLRLSSAACTLYPSSPVVLRLADTACVGSCCVRE